MVNSFLEKDLEDIIFENKNIIHERGFTLNYENLERQYVTRNGIIDLYNFEIKENIAYLTIIELKKDNIDFKAYGQIMNYFFSEMITLKSKNLKDIKINLVLVGKTYDEEVLLACSTSEIIDIYTYKYDYDGISFLKQTTGFSEFKNKIINNS